MGTNYLFPPINNLFPPRGGGRGGGGGCNCGTGMRASISKPTPFMYLALEKPDPFIYLIIQNVDLFIYCPLIFCTHLLLVVRQISQSVHWIPWEQAASKNLAAKNMCIYQDVRKMVSFTQESRKIGLFIYFFVEERGPIIYLATLKKVAIQHAHPYYAIYRKLPTPSPRFPPIIIHSYELIIRLHIIINPFERIIRLSDWSEQFVPASYYFTRTNYNYILTGYSIHHEYIPI